MLWNSLDSPGFRIQEPIFRSPSARLPSTSIALRSIDPVRHGTPPQCCQDGFLGLVLEVVLWGANKKSKMAGFSRSSRWFPLIFIDVPKFKASFTGTTSPPGHGWILWWLPRAQGHRGQDCQCWAAAYEQSVHRCSDCTQFIRWKGVSHHGPLE